MLGTVLGVLAPTLEVLNGAALTTTCLAPLRPNLCSTLRHRHHANTGFLASLSVLALPAAIFEPLLLVLVVLVIAPRGRRRRMTAAHFGGIIERMSKL